MPGLLRGLARTAAVAGTASAVAGRVQRHQASKFADRDAQTAADRQQHYQEDVSQQSVPQSRSAPAPDTRATRESGIRLAAGGTASVMAAADTTRNPTRPASCWRAKRKPASA